MATSRSRRRVDRARPRALGSVDPRVAREAFLDSLTTEEQLRVLRQAEKVGPMPDDSDWLVAYAASRAVARIEVAAAGAEARIERAAGKGSRDSGRAVLRDRGPAPELFAFALALAAFAGVAAFVARSPQRVSSLVVYAIAIALGVAASAAYVWMTRRSRRA